VHGQLGRVGAGDEAGNGEVVEEILVSEPLAALDEVPAHDGDVSGGATEGDHAEAEEVADGLPEGPAARGGGGIRCVHGERSRRGRYRPAEGAV